MDVEGLYLLTMAEVLEKLAQAVRTHLSVELLRALQSRVASGPFAGMLLIAEVSWAADGDIAPKILGCYEEELHEAIHQAAQRHPDAVINVGCGEGYYAVGLARMLPCTNVFAFDIHENARIVCREAAHANNVGDRVIISGLCTSEVLHSLVEGPGRKLVVMDCEGAELALLVPDLVAAMEGCDVIVECHDFLDASTTETLVQRFAPSHDVTIIEQSGRNPNKFPALRKVGELYRWIAVNENRPQTMNWLACWAR